MFRKTQVRQEPRSASEYIIVSIRPERRREPIFSSTSKRAETGVDCTRHWTISARKPLSKPIINGKRLYLDLVSTKVGATSGDYPQMPERARSQPERVEGRDFAAL